ncbi:MAG: ATP-binding cassette domain-containing protein [Alphaproteobacteria bacterium]|nr:ATP-binding cassette domain-containing protein [Alphaproteobacteria bacterium]
MSETPPQESTQSSDNPPIVVEDMTMAYGSFVVQKNLNFTIEKGDVFIIMGGSGCGKSTVMKALIGMQKPSAGKVLLQNESLWDAEEHARQQLLQRCGVVFQHGGLWSSLTLSENIELTLEEFTDLPPNDRKAVANLKLALVGLAGFDKFYPSEISGGMQRRAAVARALAVDPEILFFDEPSAGLDPISSRNLDELILELKESLGATIVVVTHELASIFTIGSNSVVLSPDTKTQIATGNPVWLRDNSDNPAVREFLNRGEKTAA